MNKAFIVLLCLLCLSVYFNALHNDFVLDDQYLIVENPVIRSFKHLKPIFFSGLYSKQQATKEKSSIDAMYRPMQLFSYSIDYRFWKLNAAGYHFVNIALHALNCILVFFLLSLVSDSLTAKSVSVLFCVHPLNTSVVSYISGRADLLAAFFMLLSMVFFRRFIQGMHIRLYILSLAGAFLALLCRESALILFMFILWVMFIDAEKPGRLLWIFPFLALDLLYIAWRFVIFDAGIYVPVYSMPFSLRILNFLNITAHYVYLVIIPVNLHMFRSLAFLYTPSNLNVAVAVVFFVMAVFWGMQKRPFRLVPFGMIWFLIGLIPVFFIFDSYKWLGRAMMAESWIYLSSIGIFISLAAVLKKLKRAGMALLIVAAVFYSGLTMAANNLWADNVIVYENALKYLPERNPVRRNLIGEYLKRGFFEKADKERRKFSDAYPGISDTTIFERYPYAE